MTKAVWKDTVLAESGETKIVEGNHYFPSDSIKHNHLRASTAHSVCPWKGKASYYDVVVDDDVNEQAAWYYPEPKPAAAEIKGYVAFWRGVQIVD
jgi:uncharacterized protein (DUF427 family)